MAIFCAIFRQNYCCLYLIEHSCISKAQLINVAIAIARKCDRDRYLKKLLSAIIIVTNHQKVNKHFAYLLASSMV